MPRRRDWGFFFFWKISIRIYTIVCDDSTASEPYQLLTILVTYGLSLLPPCSLVLSHEQVDRLASLLILRCLCQASPFSVPYHVALQ